LETLKKEDIGDILEKEPELLKRLFDLGEGMDNLPKMIKDGIDIINGVEAFMSEKIAIEGSAGEAAKILPLQEFMKKLRG
jgi:hypothetical protein